MSKILKIIFLVVVILVLALAVITYFLWTNKSKPGTSPNIKKMTQAEILQAGEFSKDYEPDEITVISGIVKSINNNKIQVSVSAVGNLFLQDKEFEVSVSSTTNILGVNQIVVAGKEERPKYKLSDIYVGQQIFVTSNENIRYVTSFEAKDIFLLHVK